MTTDSAIELTGRFEPETFFKGVSGKPAGEGLKVLKSLVTSKGSTEDQKGILSLFENGEFREHFGNHWERGQKAIGRIRIASSPRNSVVELARIVGEDVALAFVTLEKSLGLAFRGAGIKLGREEGPSRKYVIPFEGMPDSELLNIYENYLLACEFFKSAFLKASGKKVFEVEKNPLMPFKGAQERRDY